MGKECKPTCASRCDWIDGESMCPMHGFSHTCDCGSALVAKVEAATADMARAAGVTFGGSSSEPVASPKRRIKVRPVDGGPWCFCDDWDGVGQMIEEDGAYEFEFVMMTDEEADALGEFNGW